MNSTETLALSVRQPWAWLIVHGYKDIENRMWRTNVRGRVLIHASATVRKSSFWNAYDLAHDLVDPKLAASIPRLNSLPLGAIVGSVEIIDCVEAQRKQLVIHRRRLRRPLPPATAKFFTRSTGGPAANFPALSLDLIFAAAVPESKTVPTP